MKLLDSVKQLDLHMPLRKLAVLDYKQVEMSKRESEKT